MGRSASVDPAESVEHNLAARGAVQVEERHPRRGFAATRFPGESQNLAGMTFETNAVDCFEIELWSGLGETSADGEPFAQVARLDDRIACLASFDQ